jgi:malate synthase
VRGAKVIEFARHVLDRTRAAGKGSHKDATGYRVEGGQLVVALKNGSTTGLKNPAQFVGYQGDAAAPTSVLLQHNGLHLDIQIDRSTPIGKTDAAGVSRPGAGSGPVHHPRPGRLGGRRGRRGQGAGLQQLAGHPAGHADRSGRKGGKTFTRGLNPDRVYTAPRQAVKCACMAARCCSCATSAT